MKKIIFKVRLFSVLLLMALAFCTTLSAFAAECSSPSASGSVTVTLKAGNSAVAGAEISLFRVADAEIENDSLSFTYTDEFAQFGGLPAELKNNTDSGSLADYAAENKIDGITAITDGSGYAEFINLPLGLYLAVQSKGVKGFSDFSPFIVSVPANEGGNWTYDIDSTPKAEVEKHFDVTVKKVWNDNGKQRPDSITVELCNGGKIVDAVKLDKGNGWRHTFSDLEQRDGWSVKEQVPAGYTATYSQNGLDFTITNTASLMQTGQLKWPVPVLACAGILLFAAGWILFSKRKKKRA